MAKVVYEHDKSETCELKLLQGDVTKVGAHAIVTGESLYPEDVGAVTRTLFQIYPDFKSKRGQLFENKSLFGKAYRLFNGDSNLNKWRAYITPLGDNRPVIIHAVMDEGNNDAWMSLMRKLYSQVFAEAEKLNAVMELALPVLGTGRPDCDRDLAVEALVTSLQDYTPGYITRILIVCHSSQVLEMVEARYENSLKNSKKKRNFLGSVFDSAKLAFALYMDETKKEEERIKRQQLIAKEEEDLQMALRISQGDIGPGDDTQLGPGGQDRGHGAATASYHESRWSSDGASGREMQHQSEEHTTCPICLNHVQNPKQLHKCGHVFCMECIDRSFQEFKPMCPSCNMLYGVITGNQPDGQMNVGFSGEHLPGYEGHGTITITYYFPSGTQGDKHPKPGEAYRGTTRRAYLPDTREGRVVLKLLRKAFDLRLVFTVGRSSSTGQDDVITWNDVHHKTNKFGGPTRFGYPDPTYLQRVSDELESKGITEG